MGLAPNPLYPLSERWRRHVPLLQRLTRNRKASCNISQAHKVRFNFAKLRPFRQRRHDLCDSVRNHYFSICTGTCEAQANDARGPETNNSIITPGLKKGVHDGILVFSTLRQRDDDIEFKLHSLNHHRSGTPNGVRTRVSALKGQRPGPLDDGCKIVSNPGNGGNGGIRNRDIVASTSLEPMAFGGTPYPFEPEKMEEAVGFEPTGRSRARRFSRPLQ